MINKSEQRMEHILRRMLDDKSVDAPADALKYAKDLFRSRAIERQPSAIRRLVAALSMDLAPNKPAFGERSGSAGQARQMLFEAGDAAVDLRITRTGNKYSIRGQVLGSDFAGAAAVLAAGSVRTEATLDDLSGFEFASVKKGEYALTLTAADAEIVIETLAIR